MQFTACGGAGARVASRANMALVSPCSLPHLVRGGAKLNRALHLTPPGPASSKHSNSREHTKERGTMLLLFGYRGSDDSISLHDTHNFAQSQDSHGSHHRIAAARSLCIKNEAQCE